MKFYDPRQSEQMSREGDDSGDQGANSDGLAEVEDVHVVYKYEELHQKQFRVRRHLMSQGTHCNMDSEEEAGLGQESHEENDLSEERMLNVVQEKFVMMLEDANAVNDCMMDDVIDEMDTAGQDGE